MESEQTDLFVRIAGVCNFAVNDKKGNCKAYAEWIIRQIEVSGVLKKTDERHRTQTN